ncbi:dihydroneopterin aldolase [Paraglaciecola aquimarina]|uniref:7,8-dihydroneopterin aldolase n=1 Tax=Paraglaciecola aquimarina TaxID=1235557 RepID=A0ABU3SW65_9ALTE|nr:dihydroneopterin aldolase [Paraglaciecola aquimarina]MDU0354249.1 dihydroneopterin aldolase [Paraglaciecola aquimarina]
MDKIHIERLEVLSLIGVYDWERKNQQRLLLDIELQADLSVAAQSDNVNDTLNYALVAQKLIAVAKDSEFKLIEALASHLVDSLLQAFPAVENVRLKLSKPDILANAKNVAVEFSRGQRR